MSNPIIITLPEDFQAFAEELVRSGESASVADVVREAFDLKRLMALREAIDEGLASLDAGRGKKGTPKELMDDTCKKLGIPRGGSSKNAERSSSASSSRKRSRST